MLSFVPRRLAIWVAVLCLALTVIALGAAAKHSQFENAGHGTSYLTQSVKMVASNQMDSPALPPLMAPQHPDVSKPPARLRAVLIIPPFPVPHYGLTLATPLLV